MSKGVKPVSEVVGSIIISKTSDPAEGLKIVFNGEWAHREALSASQLVLRGFQQHMADLKRDLDLEKQNNQKESDDDTQ